MVNCRLPAVAGRFYPGDAAGLAKELVGLFAGTADKKTLPCLAVVSPHAGYVYSGAVAAATLARTELPRLLLLIGPKHHAAGARAALAPAGVWRTPLGDVPVAEKLAAAMLAGCPLLAADTAAHIPEHSLEVQLPFLQYLKPDIAIAPLVLGRLSLAECLELGADLARVLQDSSEPVLIVASTDMTHYEPRSSAAIKDRLAIERVLALDPEGLYRTVAQHGISMCGVLPVVVTLAAVRAMGGRRGELVDYRDSGSVSGDSGEVVGYAGILLPAPD